jgi:hypothetical protein
MVGSPELELLRKAWEAMRRGDLSIVAEALDPDAAWREVHDSRCSPATSTPGEEMRIVDPDGYVLMVAQIESESTDQGPGAPP